MPRSPSIVPNPDDRDVYLVLDDFGERMGRAWRETENELTDRETLLSELMTGEYNDPVRVVTFNIAEGWCRDVSEDVADELSQRFEAEGFETPEALQAFIDRHGSGRPVQLTLPLRGAA